MFIIKHQVIKYNTVGINRDHKANNVTNTRYFTHWQGSSDGMKPFWNQVPKIGYLFYTDLKTWIMKKFSR